MSVKRIFNPPFLTFVGLLLFFFYYIASRLVENPFQFFILNVAFGLLLIFPLTHYHYETHPWPRTKLFLQRLSYVSLGFMSWLLALTVIRDIMLVIIYFVKNSLSASYFDLASKGIATFILAGIMTAIGSWKAYYGLRVRRISIPIAKLPPELEGFRIAQISDLHMGPTVRKKYVEKVVLLVESLKPDLVALTGDIADSLVGDLKNVFPPLAKLCASNQVYYVPGNHEYYWKVDEWLATFASLGATVLLNRGEALEHKGKQIWVAGVSDPAASQISPHLAPNAARAAKGGELASFKLLLAHRPSLAHEASEAGFDLQLSGHTHGGQFFPWTLVVKLFHKYYIGLIRHNNMWVYISPGTGWWGPPIRIGTTPELSILELRQA